MALRQLGRTTLRVTSIAGSRSFLTSREPLRVRLGGAHGEASSRQAAEWPRNLARRGSIDQAFVSGWGREDSDPLLSAHA